MLSVANVRSAGGAANYFANDNYYTKADADRSGDVVGVGRLREALVLPGVAVAEEGPVPLGERLPGDPQPQQPGPSPAGLLQHHRPTVKPG